MFCNSSPKEISSTAPVQKNIRNPNRKERKKLWFSYLEESAASSGFKVSKTNETFSVNEGLKTATRIGTKQNLKKENSIGVKWARNKEEKELTDLLKSHDKF